MINNIFDSHAHYDDERFEEDRDILLSALPSNGVTGVINCACDLASSAFSAELANKYNYIYFACGVHPHEAENCAFSDIEKTLCELTKKNKCIAIGEIGLDYHYDFSPRDVQKKVFEFQLSMAKEFDLPVIIHDREAHEDTINLLKKYKPKGVLHCFSGSVEMAQEIIKLGMYIGLGGAVTFKNAKKPIAVAAFVPEDRLLLETDCPYMAPVPFRGARCTSDMISYTAQVIAGVRGENSQDLVNSATCNAKELFNIKE